MDNHPLVDLVEPTGGAHHHAALLSREGFRVASVPANMTDDIGAIPERSPARVGVAWLQLEPGDGAKLAAAVRGLLAQHR